MLTPSEPSDPSESSYRKGYWVYDGSRYDITRDGVKVLRKACNYYELWIPDNFGEETRDEQECTAEEFDMRMRKSTKWFMDVYSMDTQGDDHDNWTISVLWNMYNLNGESKLYLLTTSKSALPLAVTDTGTTLDFIPTFIAMA